MKHSRIAEERKKLGLSQEELATKLKISQKSISKYELGCRRPSYETLVSMSSIFGVSIDYLLGNDSHIEPLNPKIKPCSDGSINPIQYWIDKTGYGYDEIAHKLGIAENLLIDYINAKADIPYQILDSLSKICEVSTDCLLGIQNNTRPKDLNGVFPFKYNMEIKNRINNLIAKSPTPDTVEHSILTSILSMSEDELYRFINYGFIPHVDTIIKLANYFHVSCDYILCQIDEQDEKALSAFQQLNDDNKDIIIGEIKKTLKNQRYEESVAADDSFKKTGTDNLGK